MHDLCTANVMRGTDYDPTIKMTVTLLDIIPCIDICMTWGLVLENLINV